MDNGTKSTADLKAEETIKVEGTSVPFLSVLNRVCAQASAHPNGRAIVCQGEIVTFGDLVARALSMASAIESATAGDRNAVVAVVTENPHHVAVSALAAWKARLPYLPLSPSSPLERLRHMLVEANTRVVVLDSKQPSNLPNGTWAQLDFQQFVGVSVTDSVRLGALQDASLAQDDLAYVIYTSGSTGTPKGVAVTQSNLSNLVSWYNNAFETVPQDRATQIRALTSDVAVMEMWGPLSQGACIYPVDRSRYLVPDQLRDYLVENEITICEAPSLIAEQLVTLEWPSSTKLRYLQTGGETLRVFPPATLPFKFVNSYGPTECTVVSTSSVLAPQQVDGLPTIGRPITGVELFLLNADMQPVLDGERGEIFIGGAGVAAGYIGRPDLTSERFVTVPGLNNHSRLYRTGDLGRKLPNGAYEFCGRVDDQIKLRGHRIEPAEIVAALRSHPAISAAAVTTIGEGAHKQLVAYVVLRTEISATAIRNHLVPFLPDYMFPELLVQLETMPLTAHGKIDHSALPFPNRSNLLDSETSSLEPMTEIQIEVASILARVVRRPNIGFTDNFFRLGGNSLLAAQVVTSVQRVFGIDLQVRTVFESPTVKSLSAEIEQRILDSEFAHAAELPPANPA
jgi:amino acid adenylation domain-containing protein